MTNLLPILLICSIGFTQEMTVDGNLKVTGGVVFSDSSAIHTAPKDLPTGILLPYAGTAPPDGWMLCNGQEVSRETYLNLFVVIGISYGIGDGSTTFNLPDLRGRMPMGLDNMGGNSADRVANAEADSLGGNAGEESHLLSLEEMPNHSHSIQIESNQWSNSGGGLMSGENIPESHNTSNTGGNQSHNNMPPYLALNYIIKD